MYAINYSEQSVNWFITGYKLHECIEELHSYGKLHLKLNFLVWRDLLFKLGIISTYFHSCLFRNCNK